ncbi:MAG TPA: TadE family type IV pilus minor pilin [Jatrophihabitans sp.]|jgi:Flp pilus assembly protein TadG
MVTAELAACLPVLVLLLGFALSVVSVVGARVGVADTAREAARAAARGEAPSTNDGIHVEVADDATNTYVTATATRSMHLLASWLPSLRITEHATAVLEPTG